MSVIIEVRGGCVTAVATEEETTVVVVDWDNIEAGAERPELPEPFGYTSDGSVGCKGTWYDAELN